MKMFVYAYVLCVAFALVAVAYGCMTPADLLNTLKLDNEHAKEAFDALDYERDDLITTRDLGRHFWHTEAVFARAKFLEMIDSPTDKDEYVNLSELRDFMFKKPVKLAIYECKYINSRSLRKHCFADQILTFVYLVLDQRAVASFFAYLESPKDHDVLICEEEVQALTSVIPTFTKENVRNFLVEIGHDDKRITKDEFADYVVQEDLHDDFRTCRKSVKGIYAVYNNTCLTYELMDYTMNHLTELDIATVFDDFDQDDSKRIRAHEVVASTNCDEATAKRFVEIMDDSKDQAVSYGEFRTYLRSHMVKLILERGCSKRLENQEEEIKCYKTAIIQLVKENHHPVWLTNPDLDMVTVFEDMDFTNDGKISIQADLVDGKQWDKNLATKLIKEMDRPDDDDEDVSLEEFNEYVDLPNIVYAMADCRDFPKGQYRLTCYIKELKKVIDEMMEKKDVDAFFKHYDKSGNNELTMEEVGEKGLEGERLKYFFEEIAMGDNIITHWEFSWYVRQQGINAKFQSCKDNGARHTALLDYLTNSMTEYDTIVLFKEYDKDGDHEITESDFLPDTKAVKHILDKMDRDHDATVNYVEFWLHLNAPVGNPRKTHLENSCTMKEDTQAKEIICYKKEIYNLPE